jgi:hypothetical protein
VTQAIGDDKLLREEERRIVWEWQEEEGRDERGLEE